MDMEKITEICNERLGFDADAIANLYGWCDNTGEWFPLVAFQDLIGFSEEVHGAPMKDWAYPSEGLGSMEIALLAQALEAYSDRPTDVWYALETIEEMKGE
jgi:hypothetical protein